MDVQHKAKIRVISLVKAGRWDQGREQREDSAVLILVLSFGGVFAGVFIISHNLHTIKYILLYII